MHHGDAIVNNVWVRIDHGWLSVRRPTRMRNTRPALYRLSQLGSLQRRYAAEAFMAGEIARSIDQREASRVVAAIF